MHDLPNFEHSRAPEIYSCMYVTTYVVGGDDILRSSAFSPWWLWTLGSLILPHRLIIHYTKNKV